MEDFEDTFQAHFVSQNDLLITQSESPTLIFFFFLISPAAIAFSSASF